MTRRERSRRSRVAAILMGAAFLNDAAVAVAQSCSMCYTSAAAARHGAIAALRDGILILLFPPLLIFIGICVAVRRSRERHASDR